MTTDTDAGAVALALGGIALEATGWALRAVLVPVLALALTLAGCRPSSRPQRQKQSRHQPAGRKQAPEAPAGDAAPQPQPKASKTPQAGQQDQQSQDHHDRSSRCLKP